MKIILSDNGDNLKILINISAGDLSLPKNLVFKKSNIEHTFTNLGLKNIDKVEVLLLDGEGPILGMKWIKLVDLERLESSHGKILCLALGRLWSWMPEGVESKIILPALFKKILSTPKEVTFFGGSFNPWHEGHKSCLSLCSAKNIIVVPDQNPFKNLQQGGVAEFCRWSTYRKLCLELSSTNYSIFPGFWGMEVSNPTSRWVPNVNVKMKSIIMGDDSFLSLPDWIEVKKLLTSLCSIYVVPRNKSIDKINDARRDFLNFFSGVNIYILAEHKFQDLSSTKITIDK